MSELASLSQRSVLLVEDDDEAVLEISEHLTGAGIHVTVADNAADGLAAAVDAQYDATIIDINLPIRDGIRLAELLLGLDHRTRIILISGDAAALRRARDSTAHMAAILPKPFSAEGLLHLLPEALPKHAYAS